MRAAIVGIPGPILDAETRAMLRAHPPAGVIVFGRNVQSAQQLSDLLAALRAVLPEEAVLMVDQEGGRVARLRPPAFPAFPAAGDIAALHARDAGYGARAAWLAGAGIGLLCARLGFDVVCAPVLDLLEEGADPVIGNRAFGSDPAAVGELGRLFADGMAEGGVQPVIKHMPGHGRATVDSHVALPELDAPQERELAPFRANADLPWGMTAHIRFRDIDPERPATLSPRVISEVIRGQIGFDGVLVSDDLAMQALSGPPALRAARAIEAGCDLALFCPGGAQDNRAALDALPDISPETEARLARGRAWLASRKQEDMELDAVLQELGTLLA
jgi:beta-N-acetylhexosaminidase